MLMEKPRAASCLNNEQDQSLFLKRKEWGNLPVIATRAELSTLPALSSDPRRTVLTGRGLEIPLKLKAIGVMLDHCTVSDTPWVQLSNFRVDEDRETAEIVVHLARLEQQAKGDFSVPLTEYRVALPSS